MHMNHIITFLTILILVNGCSVLTTELQKLEETPSMAVDITKNGFIAFAPDSTSTSNVEVEIASLTTGETFRLNLTPENGSHLYVEIGPGIFKEKQVDKAIEAEMSIVLYELPPGGYVFKNAYIKNLNIAQACRVNSNPFYVLERKVTSFGKLNIEGDIALMGRSVFLSVETEIDNIDFFIKAFDLCNITILEVAHAKLELRNLKPNKGLLLTFQGGLTK